MNVNQLIESLQKYSGETLVLVDGYEGGFDTPSEIKTLDVAGPNPHAPWWDGRYERAKDGDVKVTGVYIPRVS
jgi:hypothetical protein